MSQRSDLPPLREDAKMMQSMHDLWDLKWNRPVVDHKVWNPQTGDVEASGSEGYRNGPPSIDIIWHNINDTSNFKTVRLCLPVTVEKVFVEIAKHIKDGNYRIVSVSASAYSFVIVCDSIMNIDDFMELRGNMFAPEAA